MKISKAAKLQAALRPRQLRPIIPKQSPRKRFRRLPRSARNPEGKLAAPAIKVRAEARAPAWARLKPNEVVISGKITATTPLKRCSTIWAVEFAASRPQAAPGSARAWVVSIFATELLLLTASLINKANPFQVQIVPCAQSKTGSEVKVQSFENA